jgi:cytochrome c oxidase subunit II
MIDSLVKQASSYAADIDFVIILIAAIVMPWFFLAEGVFLYFIIKFRAKDGQRAMDMDGSDPKHKRWVSYPHYAVLAFDLVILIFAVKVWYVVKQDVPTPETEIAIVSQQWAWTFIQPGADNTLGTPDDIKTADELHVPLNKVVKWVGTSKDVLHSFSVPVFRLKQDLIPGREIVGWFKATEAGTFDIQCAEMCGIGHGVMGARIFVETPEQHAAWMASAAGK